LCETATSKLRHSAELSNKHQPFGNLPFGPDAVFTPDGRHLIAHNSMRGSHLWIWETISQQEVGTFPVDFETNSWTHTRVAVSADGRFLCWIDFGRMFLSEAATGQIVHCFEAGGENIALSPTGWRLATSCYNEGPILVWDIATLLRSSSPSQPAPNPDALWSDLCSASATKAHRSLWRPAALPAADALLSRHLRPVEAMPADRLRTLISGLGSADFATREKVARALAEAGESVADALAEAHRNTADLEVRRRAQRLLGSLNPRDPERLREIRAVLVLEARSTPAARRLLARRPRPRCHAKPTVPTNTAHLTQITGKTLTVAALRSPHPWYAASAFLSRSITVCICSHAGPAAERSPCLPIFSSSSAAAWAG
jgi:hypothetical protein